jgi:serine/threonine protein phosphatase PrpC
VRAVGLTHPGHVRSHNEDAFAFQENLGLLIITDGLGGHGAGDLASNTAVDTVMDLFETHKVPYTLDGLTQAIVAADHAIHEKGKEGLGKPEMRTTIACALLTETDLLYAWVGDSRIYLGGGGQALTCLTKDHNLYEQKRSQGLTPEPQDKHLLTRSIGGGFETEVARGQLPRASVQAGRMLLSTDGLHGIVTQREINELLSASTDLAVLSDQLVRAALRQGGPDNISLVVADLSSN